MLVIAGADPLPASDVKVIGAGFGRTGTSSLQAALGILGYNKCYHMNDAYLDDNPQKWMRKAAGEDVDWDDLLDGYDSSVDWPVATYYAELADLIPDAKFLLTERDPDSWYRSMKSTLYTYYKLIPFWRRWISPQIGTRVEVMETLLWNGIFQGRMEDPEFIKKLFLEHNEEVKRKLPPERLLVFHVSDGWKPLCEFLGKPVPEEIPFPHVNAGNKTKRRLRKLRFQKHAPFLLLLLAAAVYFLV